MLPYWIALSCPQGHQTQDAENDHTEKAAQVIDEAAQIAEEATWATEEAAQTNAHDIITPTIEDPPHTGHHRPAITPVQLQILAASAAPYRSQRNWPVVRASRKLLGKKTDAREVTDIIRESVRESILQVSVPVADKPIQSTSAVAPTHRRNQTAKNWRFQ